MADYTVNLNNIAEAIKGSKGNNFNVTLQSGCNIMVEKNENGWGIDDLANRVDLLSGAIKGESTSVGKYAFAYCENITEADFESATTINTGAFYNCSKLGKINFPKITTVGTSAFYNCSKLTSAELPNVTNIGSNAFKSCARLTKLDLTGVKSVPKLSAGAFTYTPIGGYSNTAQQYGSVIVPASLYSAFVKATNWSTIANRIVPDSQPGPGPDPGTKTYKVEVDDYINEYCSVDPVDRDHVAPGTKVTITNCAGFEINVGTVPDVGVTTIRQDEPFVFTMPESDVQVYAFN